MPLRMGLRQKAQCLACHTFTLWLGYVGSHSASITQKGWDPKWGGAVLHLIRGQDSA